MIGSSHNTFEYGSVGLLGEVWEEGEDDLMPRFEDEF
jgi:hypothetical protein